MKLFEKLFCKHKWKVHAKTRYTIKTLFDINDDKNYNYTREVLICEHCGKIKTIEY